MEVERQVAIERSALLADRVRRALHDFVSASLTAVDRDTAAAATGISRSLAAFHLDRLARSGLLEVEYQHRGERRGPGAGRPAKFYRRPSGQQVDLSVPRRRYELAGRVLAEAIDSGAADDPVAERVADAARRAGRALAGETSHPGRAENGLIDALRREGYEPMDAGDRIMLRNCPFDALVEEHRPLVCGMNLAFLEGACEEAGAGLVAERDVRPGYCCVSLRRAD